MDFIDLPSQQQRISEKLHANIAGVLSHGQYINGPEVQELEATLAAYVGVKHAVGCASGTDVRYAAGRQLLRTGKRSFPIATTG